MTTTEDQTVDRPVRRSVTVNTSPERAFQIFTQEFDAWWPRTHHIGKSAMTKGVIEGVVGGRCYSEQADGSDCDWGTVLVWDPPRRLVLAWQIDGKWQYQPDLARSSEVDIRFTAEADGSTRVDLEHRHLGRYGSDEDGIRKMIDSQEGGWGSLLRLFAAHAEQTT